MKNDLWFATQTLPPGEEPEALERSLLLDAKVMMVDDEPLMTELIQAHLEDDGYSNFVVCNQPLQALELLRREKPDVLLLDLMMPGLSGFEVLATMRADRELRFTPVIVLTAATGADSKLRALQLGATDFLSKPVDASELVLRLRNTLAFQQYRDRLAHFDQVTGLPNEKSFEASVELMLERMPLSTGQLALFSINVPQCRQLRESLDRASADSLAIAMAERLSRVAAAAQAGSVQGRAQHRGARVARLGEQHFALVADGLADADAIEATAKLILSTLAEPLWLGLYEVVATPTLGIAVAPGDGRSASALRQSADLAATHALSQGQAHYGFASPELNSKSHRRLTLGAQLRGAAQRGELRLHYQPKVDIATGRIGGVEALVRWRHPEHGLLPPMQFIPLAEELGVLPAIGDWVLDRACRDAVAWTSATGHALKVAVNVAKPQFDAGNLCSVVRQALFDSGLPAQRLIIEITESMLMDNVDQALGLMRELRAIGVTLSIDDFGTGYSSLSYLKKFPTNELKIDRSFVIDLPGESADVALVRAVIDLGHSLGMSVIAEGVETTAQLECLTQLGCDSFQGFLHSKPMEADKLLERLATERPPRI